MALEVVGGAFLFALFQDVFRKMASGEVVEFLRGKKLTDGLLKTLEIMLLSVSVVLDDAEEKQLSNSTVKHWLDALKEAVYDAEDLLEEIKAEVLKRKLEVEPGSSTCKVRNHFPSSDATLNTRIEEILVRLEFIAKQKDVVGTILVHIVLAFPYKIMTKPFTDLGESQVNASAYAWDCNVCCNPRVSCQFYVESDFGK